MSAALSSHASTVYALPFHRDTLRSSFPHGSGVAKTLTAYLQVRKREMAPFGSASGGAGSGSWVMIVLAWTRKRARDHATFLSSPHFVL